MTNLDHLRPRRGKEAAEKTSRPSDVTVPRFRIRPSMLAGIALATGLALHSDKAEAGVATVDTSASYDIGLTFVSGEAPYRVRFCTDDDGVENYYFISYELTGYTQALYYADTVTMSPIPVAEVCGDEISDVDISSDCLTLYVYNTDEGELQYSRTDTSSSWTLDGEIDGRSHDEVNDMFYWNEYTDSYYGSDVYNEDGVVSGAQTTAWEGWPDAYGDMLIYNVDSDITLLNMSSGGTPTTLDSSGIRGWGTYNPTKGYVSHTEYTGSGSYGGYEVKYWGTTTAADGDDDGYGSNIDCNDADSSIYPGATETTGDGIDSDCDGNDDPSGSTWYRDADSDGFGDASDSTESDTQPSGYVANSTDCDDTDSAINTGADEECDGVDNDCDGDTDEDDAVDAPTWYQDLDGDGYGTTADTTRACSQPSGFADNAEDCDDANAGRNPGETEIPYNGTDDDCDPSTLDDDLDRDGYVSADDCDDTNSAINPDADERCDGVDNDCDGDTDEDDAVDAELWYADNDGDNYGTGDPVLACNAPTGYSAEDGDCDDDSFVTYPDAPELCDEVDNDCDEVVDNDVTYVDWYLDSDGDRFGDPATGLSSCEDLSWDGYVTNDEDCDDNDYYVNPDATEVYDGVDNNCDGNTDLTDPTCEVIWTNCDDSAASLKGVGDLMIIMAPEDCIIEYTIAKGVEEGTCAYSYLDRSTSVEMFFDGIDSSGYYVTEITSEKGVIDFTSEGAETEIFEGADGYFFGHSGSGRIIDKDGYMMTGIVTAPTINLVHDVNGGDVYKEDLEELARMTSEGDVAVVNTQDGTFEINPDENPDDTGETDDTGITTPPDGCPGCASLDGSRAGYGLAMLGLAGLATATGRRRRYQPELDGYSN